jgi:hypothetical protein
VSILKHLSKVDMTTCHCGRKLIPVLPFKKPAEIFFDVDADGKKATRFKHVPICFLCFFKMKLNEAAHKALMIFGKVAVCVILNLLVVWFFHGNLSASSEEPAFGMGFAPKATASKPILIPPENRDAWRR